MKPVHFLEIGIACCCVATWSKFGLSSALMLLGVFSLIIAFFGMVSPAQCGLDEGEDNKEAK